jgi:hypothetical protein
LALIIRIDVDRPYGKHPLTRHVLSRLSSDVSFPRIESFGYLKELNWMLQILNARQARAYVFFRRCTLPFERTMELLDEGRHEIGLHLENSRSYETFEQEKLALEQFVGREVLSMSKHGSGGAKYGRRHHAPYEPGKYVNWARKTLMKVFLGNLEDPTLWPTVSNDGFHAFPSAFWLEPSWRDTNQFSVDWLFSEGKKRDVVLLVHPENVLESHDLTNNFKALTERLESRIIQ